MKKTILLYILVVAVTLGYRLYPTVASQQPFSIDAWPLLYDAKTIQEATPISLEDGRLDGYNSFWPGSIFASLSFSLISDINVETLMRFFYPVVNGLGVALFLFLMGRRIGGVAVGLLATLIMGLLYPAYFMGAGVAKETYAITLYLLTIYLALFRMEYRRVLPAILVAPALVFVHHLTTLLTFVSLLAVGLLYLLRMEKCGLSILSIAAIIFGTAYIHYNTLGYLGLRLPELLPETIISFVAYLTVFLFIGYIHPGRPPSESRLLINTILLLTISASLIYTVMMGMWSDEIPALGSEYLIYSFQYLVLWIVVYVATHKIRSSREGRGVYYWFLGVAALTAYAVVGGAPVIAGVSYRLIDFIIPSMALLAAYAAARSEGLSGVVSALAIILPIAILSTTIFINGFYLEDPNLGYSWRNRAGLVNPGRFILMYGDRDNLIVYGDSTMKYIYGEYYRLEIHTNPTYIERNPKSTGRDLILIYREMMKNGFVLGAFNFKKLSTQHLGNNLGRIYDNQELWIYM